MMNKTNEPDDVETLLPWHAAGTLEPRDARRVEEALARDPDLVRRFELVREELGEAIRLNENLGAPSARAMDALFRKIDAEPKRTARASFNLGKRVSGFFASLTPRTLAWSATAAAIAILLQAGIIGGSLMNERQSGGYQTASAPGAVTADGSFVMARFAPAATAADITAFLQANDLSIAAGPVAGGFYRLRISGSKMTKEQLAGRARELQQDKRVDLIVTVD